MSGTAVRNPPTQVSIDVVEAIATVAGVDPSALETPLYEAVDTDALDAIVSTAESARIAFEYEGHNVVVAGDGRITVDGQAPAGV